MMKLSDFYKCFPEESTCCLILRDIRQRENSIICKKCGSIEHYWKNDKKSFECKKCKFRTSIKSGTIMEHSNLPLKYWLSTIAFLEIMRKNISALELQKEFGHKRYEPIWLMLKKIRNMSEADYFIYKITDYIQLDKDENEIKFINIK
ncbi:MAG: hypothetical protein U9N54_09675 [candidate division Zixibacteria bacterium]|nr:hypothetical protein [candidate division Zixibacteria bacterium]